MTTFQKSTSSSSSHHHHSSKDVTNSSAAKQDEFRRYLESTGLLDALTKVLVGLYEEPERPASALDYVKRYLGAPTNVDVQGLQQENAKLHQQVVALQSQLEQMQQTNNNNNNKHSQPKNESSSRKGASS